MTWKQLTAYLVGCGCCCLLLLASASGNPPPDGEGSPAIFAGNAEYVGSETCATCHDDYEAHLAVTGHGQNNFRNLSDRGCETCHGPGSVHMDDPDNAANWPRVDRLEPDLQSAVCRTCHDGAKQFFWEGSMHQARGMSCITCHSVHSPKSDTDQLQTAQPMEQCFTCHKDVRAETWKTSHHPVREGLITCGDCHNPHGSAAEGMITAVSVNEQCYSCHGEKRGPFIWEHPPVRENCLTCHSPHGSNHLKLQRTSVPFICQQCHANTRHPGTLYDASSLADGGRASNREFNRACLDCHASIHGSNHPSSPYLGH